MNPIRSFAEKETLSTYQVARLAEVSQPTVCRHMNGQQKISKKSIRRYSRRLGIKAQKLHEWNEKLDKKRRELDAGKNQTP